MIPAMQRAKASGAGGSESSVRPDAAHETVMR